MWMAKLYDQKGTLSVANMKSLFVALAIAFGLTSCETTDSVAPVAGEPSQTAVAPSGEAAAPVSSGVKPYPRNSCLVTGEKLDAKGTPMTFVHKGQEVKVCCVACEMAFKMSPGTYLAKIQ